MRRRNVNKSRSVKKFRRSHSKTRRINVAQPLMRGGIRL